MATAPMWITDDAFGLLWIAVAGFIVGFVLAKLKVVTDNNVARFANWAACLVAALAASLADTTASGPLLSMVGRLAIFGIVWFAFSVIFMVGVSLGLEKATKNDD